MHSIRFRLIVLFIVVTTTTLAAFGGYAQLLLSRELEERFEQLQTETVHRLTISAPRPLWDLDTSGANDILAAEMLPHELLGIQILATGDRIFASARRDEKGVIVSDPSPAKIDGIRVEGNLYRLASGVEIGAHAKERPLLGKVVVYFTREHIDALLEANLWRRIVEILVVDCLLVLALTISLHMVFKPLAQLRDALFDLSRHESEDAEELPETQRSEFGEVIQGFNMTQRKLKSVIERRRLAEDAARGAATKMEQAFAELQAAQASLLQSEKLASLGGLVAGVAHEINTPVGITLTSASVLQDHTSRLRKSMADGAIKKSEITAYMDTAEQSAKLILANAERAAHLIQSFKQVAADQTSEIRREYELKEYIDEVMSSLHPKLKQGGAHVVVNCPEKILLDGYPGAMAQVLTNLTMNALAHAFVDGKGGEIVVSAEQAGDSVNMVFKDSGRGIPAEHIGKVFDPFFTTRRGQGGTGLGLNIVHNIISKQFGGTIAVSSEPGQGACFSLHFPRVSPRVVQE